MTLVRAETTEDYLAVRQVNELAFGRPDEALLVDKLRAVADPQISLVAIKDEQVVGHIFFSPVSIEITDAASLVLALGPLAILPEYQKQGLGSQLVQAGFRDCRRIGCNVVVVLGHPEYYPRFGFIPAKNKALRCEWPVPDEMFMVAELTPEALNGLRGLVKYLPEFNDV
jgi:putative acetyltransferase